MNQNKISFAALTMAFAVSTTAAQAKIPVFTLNGGGGTVAFYALTQNLADFTKTPDLFAYVAVGNDTGQKAFLDNDSRYLQPKSAANPKGYGPGPAPSGPVTYGTISGPSVAFTFANTPLSSSEIASPSPAGSGGPLIQFPLIGIAITIAYNSPGTTLTLTDAQTCGVLSGKITDWNSLDPSIAPGTTINAFVPTDGSISTYLLTQHLNAVCTSSNSSFPEYPVPVTRYFYDSINAITPVFPNGLPANFVGVQSDPNIAAAMTATAHSFGYLPAEYTSIAPKATLTTSLQVASLVNSQNSIAYLPTTTNIALAFANPGPGAQHVMPPSTMATAQYQPNWAPTFPQPAAGYPLVGFPMAILLSCYDVAHAPHLLGAIRHLISRYQPYATNDLNQGYLPLQSAGFGSAYTKAINRTFLSNKTGFNLDIDNPTTCASYIGR